MLGCFPRKLNPAFLLGLTHNELKFPDDFIPKLKSPIPRSDDFNQFLEDWKNNPSEMRITCCRDITSCTTGEHACESCVHQYIRIQLAICHLKEGSFYEFMIQNNYNSNLQSGSMCVECNLKAAFGKWDIDYDKCLRMLKHGMVSSML